jgi:hemoglobin
MAETVRTRFGAVVGRADDPRSTAGRTPSPTLEGVDITTREDCERLVRAFYGRAMTDPIIGWLFTDVARLDLEEHVPVITSFWETVLLGGQSYRGGTFRPHAVLHRKAGLRHGHFVRWLGLWEDTVNELFDGPTADEAKAHARRVAAAFQRRLAGLPEPHEPAHGLVVTVHRPV